MSDCGDCSLVQRLTILNHITLPHDRRRTQMLKAITIATYNAAAGSRSHSAVPLLMFLASCHFTPLLFTFTSALSSFTLTKDFLVSSFSRFLNFIFQSFLRVYECYSSLFFACYFIFIVRCRLPSFYIEVFTQK